MWLSRELHTAHIRSLHCWTHCHTAQHVAQIWIGGCMERKWSLDPDPRSASVPDPSSHVESPYVWLIGINTIFTIIVNHFFSVHSHVPYCNIGKLNNNMCSYVIFLLSEIRILTCYPWCIRKILHLYAATVGGAQSLYWYQMYTSRFLQPAT